MLEGMTLGHTLPAGKLDGVCRMAASSVSSQAEGKYYMPMEDTVNELQLEVCLTHFDAQNGTLGSLLTPR